MINYEGVSKEKIISMSLFYQIQQGFFPDLHSSNFD